jgi:tetratricopeptide (TPR) repeat protein
MIIAAPNISFDGLYPAQVNIPKHIDAIAIVDNSKIESKLLNAIEGGLSGEGLAQDKLASQICIDGLFNKLNRGNRFTVVRTTEVYKVKTTGVEFPQPLSWEKVDSLCKVFNVNAIIALEIFDSNFMGTFANVKLGFRLYDPSERNIIDQYRFEHKIALGAPVHTMGGAISRVLEKNDAINDVSYQAGELYGQRITPTWFRITRQYYNKPKRDENLRIGARMMEVNNWDEAILSLEKAVDSGKKRKTRGRAAHNLAVVYEILGDYPAAKKWAQDAWGKYENKDSKDYLYVLNRRISEIERLQYQQD